MEMAIRTISAKSEIHCHGGQGGDGAGSGSIPSPQAANSGESAATPPRTSSTGATWAVLCQWGAGRNDLSRADCGQTPGAALPDIGLHDMQRHIEGEEDCLYHHVGKADWYGAVYARTCKEASQRVRVRFRIRYSLSVMGIMEPWRLVSRPKSMSLTKVQSCCRRDDKSAERKGR